MPGVVSERDVRAALKAGTPSPVYVLVGDDEKGKDALIDAFEALVEPDLRAFNYDRVYANEKDTDSAGVAASASTLPFIAARRVIVVMRAEHWFKPKGRASAADEAPDTDDDDAPPGAQDALEAYLKDPSGQTVLVFVASDVNRSLRQTKALVKVADVVEYWGLKDDKDLRGQALVAALEKGRRLVVGLLKEAGLAIDADALDLVAESGGTEVDPLRNAVDRLIAFCKGRSRVTLADARAIVSGEALVNDWAIVNAVEQGELAEALNQLRLQLDDGRAPHQVFGMLGWWVREKLPQNPRARIGVPQAVEALMQANLALNSASESRMVLERFIITLCGADGVRRR